MFTPTYSAANNTPNGISFKVKTIDKPKITLSTEELNQYNKKVLAYKKIEYGEATIRLHDTVDDHVLSFWVNYFTYYFGDSRTKEALAYTQSPVDPTFTDSSGWGLRPLVDTTNFFSSVDVYAFYGNLYTQFSYINPRITAIDWQTKDVSSDEPEEVSVSFRYEAIQYLKFGEQLSSAPKSLADFGFGLGTAPSGSILNAATPKILSTTTSVNSSPTTNNTNANATSNAQSPPPAANAPGASVPNSTTDNQYGTPPT